MMELALIKTLLDRDFYEQHKGIRCPDHIFSKDTRGIKQALDAAMETYEGSLSVQDLQAVFTVQNKSMTTATKTAMDALFRRIEMTEPIKEEIAQDTLSQLFQNYVGDVVANLGFDYVNGTENSLEPLRKILDDYKDDFTPNLNVEWEDISLDTILSMTDLESQWTFNIPTLTRKVEGINAGHLIEVGARPNTGKTSFHASLVASPQGFAWQGAKCIILCNEEGYHRVAHRYITAATGMDKFEISKNKKRAMEVFDQIRKNVMFKDATGRDMNWVESVCKSYKPDIVILDMGDKFAKMGGFARPDEALKANAIHARQIAKQHECAMFYMSQLSAEAEGKVVLNQAMMEGSRTGKAAEADLMIMISKNPTVEGQEEEDNQRHINVVKNKLSGWHGIVHTDLEYKIARYVA